MASSTTGEVLRQFQSPLFSLPAELVLAVIAQLSDDLPTLCTLARTCRLVHPLCEEHIYTTIELFSTNDLRAILHAFARRPARVEIVHTLGIAYTFHDDLSATVEERSQLNRQVKCMKALKDWHIESPYDNFKWEEGGHEWVSYDMEEFRRALEFASFHPGRPLQGDVGLAKLEKLVIHSHGAHADFWELKGFDCLFRHPSLRYLHVSCVSLPTHLPQLEPFAASTPLDTLIFDECELEPGSLRQILSAPRSLKRLTLGENVHNINRTKDIHPKLSNAPDASLHALLSVSHSLESLTHLDPSHLIMADPWNPSPLRLPGPGMRDFHRLKFIDVDRCSFLHRGILVSRTLAPPNLDVIRLHHPRRQFSSFIDELPDAGPYMYLPSLRTLELVQPASDREPDMADYVCHPERLRERHAYAYKLWKQGVNMKLYVEMLGKVGLIPPYLHGEPCPVPLCVYDAAEVGFYRVIGDDDEEVPLDVYRVFHEDGFGHSRAEIDCRAHAESLKQKHESKLPETDQLSNRDVSQMRNTVWRKIWNHLAEERGESQTEGSEVNSFLLEIDSDLDADLDGYFDLDEFLGHPDELEDEEGDDEDFDDADDGISVNDGLANALWTGDFNEDDLG